ncbi:MAG TPA: murein transglycosylase domain-containing protein [Rhodopila sp.]|jgi:membrane-bound lytic murein transglycosylase C
MSTKNNLNHVLPRRAFLLGCTAFVAGCATQHIGSASIGSSRAGAVGNASDSDDLIMQQTMLEATRRLTAKCTQLWGRGNVKLPTAKTWVSYCEDLKCRGEMDFEHGVFTAQVLVDADKESDTMEKAVTRLRKRLHIAETITPAELPDDDVVAKLAAKIAGAPPHVTPTSSTPERQTPVLAGLLPRDAMTKLTPAALERLPVTGEDGRERVMLSYHVPFKDHHFLILAARYAEPVAQAAERFGLAPSLIYAVIETESAFNPRARSPAPAFGLMQLVPRTGGRDAWAYLYGEAREPDPDTLYDPGTNITLGTAYLKPLSSRYLKSITDETSRTYATIAAYNTGAGNVAKAFEGTTRIATAAHLINTLSSDETLHRLTMQLPYEETRRYLTAVVAREARYRSFDGSGSGQVLVSLR